MFLTPDFDEDESESARGGPVVVVSSLYSNDLVAISHEVGEPRGPLLRKGSQEEGWGSTTTRRRPKLARSVLKRERKKERRAEKAQPVSGKGGRGRRPRTPRNAQGRSSKVIKRRTIVMTILKMLRRTKN